jgi:hypothetical protein
VSAGTPYRKPSPTPPPERNVVKLAESPEDEAARVEREIAAARQRSYRAQSARAQLELEAERGRYDRFLRLAGAFFLLIGLGLLALDVHAVGTGAESITVSRTGPWVLFVGPYLSITGSAGASSKDSLPTWWKVGIVAAFLLGPIVGSSFEVDLTLALVDLFYG